LRNGYGPNGGGRWEVSSIFFCTVVPERWGVAWWVIYRIYRIGMHDIQHERRWVVSGLCRGRLVETLVLGQGGGTWWTQETETGKTLRASLNLCLKHYKKIKKKIKKLKTCSRNEG